MLTRSLIDAVKDVHTLLIPSSLSSPLHYIGLCVMYQCTYVCMDMLFWYALLYFICMYEHMYVCIFILYRVIRWLPGKHNLFTSLLGIQLNCSVSEMRG